MNNTVLEITDQEYLIKLNKQEYNPSFIESLLSKIHLEKPLIASFFYDEEDLFSRRLANEERSFDHLSEK